MYKVVYVMGSSHCGSTLFAFLLNNHPQIVSIGEAAPSLKYNKKRHLLPCSCGQTIENCVFWQTVFQKVSQKGFEFTPENWTMIHCQNITIHKYFYRHHTNILAEIVRRLLLPFHLPHINRVNRVNQESIKTILEITNTKVFVDISKNPDRLELLMRAPELDIRLIWLVRDVRAFVNSMRRRAKQRGSKGGLELEDAALQWKNEQMNMRRIYNRFPDNKKLLLKYEELTKAPKRVLNSVFKFVGVREYAMPEDYKSAPHHIIGNKMRLERAKPIVINEKWRENISIEEQEKALKIAGNIAAALNYR